MNTKNPYSLAILLASLLITGCDGGDNKKPSETPPGNGEIVSPPGNESDSEDNTGTEEDDQGEEDLDTEDENTENENTENEGTEDDEIALPPMDDEEQCAIHANAITAVKMRDAALAEEAELLDYSLCLIDFQKNNPSRKQAIEILYEGQSTYRLSGNGYSHYFSSLLPAKTFPIIGSTTSEFYSLAMAGEQSGHRYMALTYNLTHLRRYDTNHYNWMSNAVTWLTQNQNKSRASRRLLGDNDKNINVVIAHMSDRNQEGSNEAHYDDLKTWLENIYKDHYTLNASTQCDYDKLLECLSNKSVDLLILGSKDKQNLGYPGIREGVEFAVKNKIPLLTATTTPEVTPILSGVYDYMEVSAYANIGGKQLADNYPVQKLFSATASELAVESLLKNMRAENFNASVFDSTCNANMMNCNAPEFNDIFRTGASTLRSILVGLDNKQIDVLTQREKYALPAVAVILADKYRKNIDYPISATNEAPMFQKALFADWVVTYARPDNHAQPDLGEYIFRPTEVIKGVPANYRNETISSESKTISINYPKQWTTSGWYAPAGKPVTISSSKVSANVIIQLGFGYKNVNRAGSTKILNAPSEVSHLLESQLETQRTILLSPGEKITFSSPYGAPIYIRFNDNSLTSADLSAEGVMNYPVITDLNDNMQLSEFERLIAEGDVPHVDIRNSNVEIHAMKYRLMDGLDSNKGDKNITTMREMLDGVNNFYIWNYGLAGFTIQGMTLEESLPSEVLRICVSLFGADCTNESLHIREIIQHANYDQRSRCVGGIGCAGNPFDTGWAMEPYGWGENHELGHNLQVKRLNVHYAKPGTHELWSSYSSRATETSNNIFPYHTLWKNGFSFSDTVSAGTHGNPREVFAMVMSELRGLKDVTGNDVIYNGSCSAYPVMDGLPITRYTAAWQSDAYAIHNAPREAFYFQMLLQADKNIMRNGVELENGFNIFTLLYQHNRIYGKYAVNEAQWNENRERLGFSLFPFTGGSAYDGSNVSDIPGNDFMLVSLGLITNADWRPYFDMFGLYYTSLASQQVTENGFSRAIEQKIYTNKNDPKLMPNMALTSDPDLMTVDMTDKDSTFPGVDWNCS
ncbi:MAG TPA: ImpA family metalloprotease [Buttiauxella sp.]|jgi:hypothetical protein